jgi:hypothetical protein
LSRPLPLFVTVATFCLCVGLAAPGLTWLDGGELALAAGTMGVAHPPGEPAWLVLARLAALVPIGDLPFRLALLSAATVAAAAGLLSVIVADVAGRLSWVPGANVPMAGLVAGLLFGFAPAVVMQGVRLEVYGLAIALGLASVRCLQLGGRRGVALAVIPLAVAGAVHHAMLVAAIPGLFLLATGRGRGSMRAAIACATLLVLPALLQFAWLPLRSLTDPALDFGSPRSWDRVVHAVTAAGYARSFHPTEGQITANLLAHLRLLRADLGLLALLLGVVALRASWQRRRRHAIAMLLLLGVGLLPTVLQGVFTESNPDARGYLLGPVAVLAAGAGIGASLTLSRLRGAAPRLAPWIGTALILGLVLPAALNSVRQADRRDLHLPAVLGAALLDGAAPGALVLPAGDSWAFPPLYLRYWEGRRPDVHVLPLHMLEPGALPGLAARGVPLPASLDAATSERLASAHRGLMPEHLLLELHRAGQLPATVQVNDVFLPLELLRARRADGLLYRLGAEAPGGDAAEERLWTATLEPEGRAPGYERDPIGPATLGRRYGSRGGFHRSRGEPRRAGLALQRGSALEPDDGALIQLMRWRFDEGMEQDPFGPDVDRLFERAATHTLAGQLDEAERDVRSILSSHPTHPEALLLAERLYSVGVQATPPLAAPDEATR